MEMDLLLVRIVGLQGSWIMGPFSNKSCPSGRRLCFPQGMHQSKTRHCSNMLAAVIFRGTKEGTRVLKSLISLFQYLGLYRWYVDDSTVCWNDTSTRALDFETISPFYKGSSNRRHTLSWICWKFLKSNTSVSRNDIDNTIHESGASPIFLDIGTEVINLKVPMGGVIWKRDMHFIPEGDRQKEGEDRNHILRNSREHGCSQW